jgi:hypothetical protein
MAKSNLNLRVVALKSSKRMQALSAPNWYPSHFKSFIALFGLTQSSKHFFNKESFQKLIQYIRETEIDKIRK